MRIDILAESRETVAATLMAAAVLIGAALGSAPSEALAGTATSDEDTATAVGSAQWFAMTGDAMEPAIPQGALTIAELRDPDAVQAGDIVTVAIQGGLATRRVTSIDRIDAGRLLTLQADANAQAEAVGIMFTDKATVVRAYVPLLGYGAEIAGKYGRAIALILGLAVLGLAVLARARMRRPEVGIGPVPSAPVVA